MSSNPLLKYAVANSRRQSISSGSHANDDLPPPPVQYRRLRRVPGRPPHACPKPPAKITGNFRLDLEIQLREWDIIEGTLFFGRLRRNHSFEVPRRYLREFYEEEDRLRFEHCDRKATKEDLLQIPEGKKLERRYSTFGRIEGDKVDLIGVDDEEDKCWVFTGPTNLEGLVDPKVVF